MSEVTGLTAPSTWFVQHAGLIQPDSAVLDIACGDGRHAVVAARRGARVTGIDGDPARLRDAETAALHSGVTVTWMPLDLSRDPLPPGPFDVVMVFYYLDRARMSDFLNAVKPGGYFLAETYLEAQRELGEGPTCDDHLLKPGELTRLIQPLQLVHAREVMEQFDNRARIIASVLAQRLVA